MQCKTCGRQAMPGEKFCMGCGAQIESSAQIPDGGNQLPEGSNQTQISAGQTPAPQPVNNMNNMEGMVSPVSEPAVPQMPITQPVNNQMPPKQNNLIIIVVGIVAIIAVAIGGYFIGKMTNDNGSENTNNQNNNAENNNNNQSNTQNSNNSQNNNSNQSSSNQNNNQTPVQTSNTTNITLSGFTFDVPNEFGYELDGDSLFVGNDFEGWVAEIFLADAAYPAIVTNQELVKANFEAEGIIVDKIEEKKYNNVTYLIFEVSAGGQRAIYAYTQASAKYSFGVFAVNKTYTIDHEILNKISKVLASAQPANRNSIKQDTTKFKTPDLKAIIK